MSLTATWQSSNTQRRNAAPLSDAAVTQIFTQLNPPKLDLAHRNVTSLSTQTLLARHLGTDSTCKELNLEGNSFAPAVELLVTSILNNPSSALHILSLRDNNIRTGSSIARLLRYSLKLVRLDTSVNCLGEDERGVAEIFIALAQNAGSALMFLDISSNGIKKFPAADILLALQRDRNLYFNLQPGNPGATTPEMAPVNTLLSERAHSFRGNSTNNQAASVPVPLPITTTTTVSSASNPNQRVAETKPQKQSSGGLMSRLFHKRSKSSEARTTSASSLSASAGGHNNQPWKVAAAAVSSEQVMAAAAAGTSSQQQQAGNVYSSVTIPFAQLPPEMRPLPHTPPGRQVLEGSVSASFNRKLHTKLNEISDTLPASSGSFAKTTVVVPVEDIPDIPVLPKQANPTATAATAPAPAPVDAVTANKSAAVTTSGSDNSGSGGLSCSHCKAHIVEFQYRCFFCQNFVLCVRCYNANSRNPFHQPDHTFVGMELLPELELESTSVPAVKATVTSGTTIMPITTTTTASVDTKASKSATPVVTETSLGTVATTATVTTVTISTVTVTSTTPNLSAPVPISTFSAQAAPIPLAPAPVGVAANGSIEKTAATVIPRSLTPKPTLVPLRMETNTLSLRDRILRDRGKNVYSDTNDTNGAAVPAQRSASHGLVDNWSQKAGLSQVEPSERAERISRSKSQPLELLQGSSKLSLETPQQQQKSKSISKLEPVKKETPPPAPTSARGRLQGKSNSSVEVPKPFLTPRGTSTTTTASASAPRSTPLPLPLAGDHPAEIIKYSRRDEDPTFKPDRDERLAVPKTVTNEYNIPHTYIVQHPIEIGSKLKQQQKTHPYPSYQFRATKVTSKESASAKQSLPASLGPGAYGTSVDRIPAFSTNPYARSGGQTRSQSEHRPVGYNTRGRPVWT